LESLVIPEVNAAQEDGKLIISLPQLWASANDSEKRKLVLSVLDAVYVDAKKTKTIVAIKPKPPFRPILQMEVSKKGSDIRILSESLKDSPVFPVETGEAWSPLRSNVLMGILIIILASSSQYFHKVVLEPEYILRWE
jgi:site-specific DNA recombinase